MKREKNCKYKNGIFVVSLDFELFWGVADTEKAEQWENNIKKVYEIVPRTLKLFEKYGVQATWATVGAIMLEDESELASYLPIQLPQQTKVLISKLGLLAKENKIPSFMLFGNELVKMIMNIDGQEIGTHTFTHYYCSNENSNVLDFEHEVEIAANIMKNKEYGDCKSIVFPRNQVSERFVSVLPKNIKAYRGSIPGFIDKLKKKYKKIGTIVWYIDHYIPLQNSTYNIKQTVEKNRYNIKLSRLFKAYKYKYRFFENLKLRRYKKEMEYAAKKGKIYHICWHPHNFSTYTDENFKQLDELLKKYYELNLKYGMVSMNMSDVVDKMDKSITI